MLVGRNSPLAQPTRSVHIQPTKCACVSGTAGARMHKGCNIIGSIGGLEWSRRCECQPRASRGPKPSTGPGNRRLGEEVQRRCLSMHHRRF